MNTVTDTALATAEAMAPALIAAAVVANPQAASIAQMAPIMLQLMQTATQLHGVGAMTDDQLAALFANVGAGVAATHATWSAMNVQAAAPVAVAPAPVAVAVETGV